MEIKRVLEALPPESLVPVGWVLENLGRDPDPLVDYTAKDLSKLLGRSPVTVRAWCRSGELRAYRMRGRVWRIPIDALREFQARQKRQSASG